MWRVNPFGAPPAARGTEKLVTESLKRKRGSSQVTFCLSQLPEKDGRERDEDGKKTLNEGEESKREERDT